ncbi:MAG: serine/threonine-protein phosphatase, partial [Thermoanaerobaculia bacterium]|nr:serine/threonine-protein phosphatase [Thermoanaerobaculia bacterium]
QRVGQGSYPLGIRDRGNWIEERGSLAPRETLVFVSDGLPEARSLAGEDYGYERLEALLTANAGAAPQTIVNLLTSELRSFLGGRVPEDDVSIAVIRKT